MATKNERNPLESRYHQMRKYMQIAIVGIIVCCVMMGVNLVKLQQNEAKAINNASQQANVTKNSDICKTFPKEPLCVLAKKISKDPKQELPANTTQGLQGAQGVQGVQGIKGITGATGPTGPAGPTGVGVKTFTTAADGHLIVTFSDDTTKDLGYIVGATGADGAVGKTGSDGRGIVTTSIDSGQLVVTYTDGTVQTVGNIVGPKGDTGAAGANGTNGADGKDGKDGKDGLTITDISTDEDGVVTVTYSNGDKASAGTIADTTAITTFTCENNVLTITLSNGSSKTADVQCPVALSAPAPAPAPAPTPAP